MIKLKELFSNQQWIETEKLTYQEKIILRENYQLPQEALNYVTDKDERPHYVYEPKSKYRLFIVQIPYVLDPYKLRYITQPISFLIYQNKLFTFNESKVQIFSKCLKKTLATPNISSFEQFILKTVYFLMDSYVPIMHEVTKKRNSLDKALNKVTKNIELVALSTLKQTLIFFLSASKLNDSLFQFLENKKFWQTGKPKALLEDAVIEGQQVQRMVQIEADVVNGISDSFNEIGNNNLNETMKFLTIWTLALTIPTMITGFYGMNIHLPGATITDFWVFVIVLSIFLITGLLVLFKYLHRL